MKNRLLVGLGVGIFILAAALSAFAQTRTPVVISKFPYAGVAMTANGNLWTAAKYVGNYGAALVSIRKTGTVSACTLTFYTGPSAATATNALDDANNNFSCATAVNKVVNNIDQYLQGTVSSWTGTGTITVYVTLVNGVGWNLNATLSAVTQSTGAGDRSSLWRTQPGYDTTAFLDIEAGVGAQGAGVQQVGSLFTLSAAVASATLTEVVAAPGSGSVYLGGLLVEKKSGTPTITVQYGTGTNCGTGTAVLAGPITPVNEHIPLGVLVPATKALCLQTDGTSTGVRALTQ